MLTKRSAIHGTPFLVRLKLPPEKWERGLSFYHLHHIQTTELKTNSVVCSICRVCGSRACRHISRYSPCHRTSSNAPYSSIQSSPYSHKVQGFAGSLVLVKPINLFVRSATAIILVSSSLSFHPFFSTIEESALLCHRWNTLPKLLYLWGCIMCILYKKGSFTTSAFKALSRTIMVRMLPTTAYSLGTYPVPMPTFKQGDIVPETISPMGLPFSSPIW